MIGNVTKSAVDKLSGGWLWDKGVVGFGARKQTAGVFYYIRYRAGGRQKMQSIGRHGTYTPDTARTEAKRLLGMVAAGSDPSSKSTAANGVHVGTTIDRYLAKKEAVLKPNTYTEVVRHLRDHSKPLHREALADVSRRSIAELLGKIETGSGLVTRNRVRSSLSAFFRWCISEGLCELNPVTGTAVADEGASRSRVLSDDELKLICHSLQEDRFSDIVRLLLLTGQRREEIGGLRWDEIVIHSTPSRVVAPNGLHESASLRLPPERVKNNQEHTLPLSPQAQAILMRQSRRSDFVFGPFTGWSSAKASLDARTSGVADWRLHDLRRTMETRLGDLGVLPHVVECILNHLGGFRSGVAGVYNRANYSGPMREALALWANHLDEIAAQAVTAPLRQRPKSIRLVRA